MSGHTDKHHVSRCRMIAMAKDVLPSAAFGVIKLCCHILPAFTFVKRHRIYQLNPGADQFCICSIFDPGYFHAARVQSNLRAESKALSGIA